MLRIWEGGLSLTGALVFAALAGVIAARLCRESILPTLDAFTPGLLLFAACARLAEWPLGVGYGPEMPFSLPILTREIGGAARLNTALLMALAALLPLCLRRKDRRPGQSFFRAAFLYFGALLLLESLRRDGHLLWGFVHAEQVFAALLALAALLAMSGRPWRFVWPILATALLACAVVALEFALDRSKIGDGFLYLIYAVVVGAYCAWGLTRRFERKNQSIQGRNDYGVS